MMKILFYDKSKIYSGAEKSLIPLAKCMKDVESRILFNYPQEHHQNYLGLKKVYRNTKLRFWMGSDYRSNNWRGTDFLKRIIFAAQLFFILKKQKPDIFHVNLYRDTDYLDLIIAKWCKVKCVVHVRSLLSQVKISYNRIKYADLIITTSEFVKSEVLSVSKQLNVVSIYDPIIFTSAIIKDSSLVEKFKERHKINKSTLLVSSVGILDPRKGHDTAIEGMAKLAEKMPNFQLLIAGGSLTENRKEVERLQQLAIAYAIQDKVKFLGHVAEIDVLYAASDIILALSRDGEAFGRVPLEAAAHKKIVIGTKKGATPEIIKDQETGFLVEADAPSEVANLIFEYHNQEAILNQIRLNAFTRLSNKFSVNRHCEAILTAYKTLLDR